MLRKAMLCSLFFTFRYCDFCKKITCRALQGALKLKITMKGPKKEDSEKIKCEKSKKTVTKKLKTNHGNKVIIINNIIIFKIYVKLINGVAKNLKNENETDMGISF